MSETGDDTNGRSAVREAALDEQTFLRLTASGRLRGADAPLIRVVVRLVLVQVRRRLQFSYFDRKQDITKNFTCPQAKAKLDELLVVPRPTSDS
jgi:hypothetical protein